MKRIFISIIFVISLIITILFIDVQISTFDKEFYSNKFDEYNIQGITKIEKDTLMEVTDELLKYMKGKRDDLIIRAEVNGKEEVVFEERERLHMVDVKDLFEKGFIIKNIAIIILIISLFFIIKFYPKILYKLLMISSIVPILILGLFGIAISINFNKYFTIFHEILFTNDLWLLNPKTDILIQMLPLDFFYSISMRILTYFILQLIILFLLGIGLREKHKME
ncbi:TIGR01906 family membrane protein [Clostridium sp. D2Q-11]|uniref:TIGR01906 family membrane protein n=1 Tax=Anaeromonas frigoriresistens TaxID=2683708 RepID=A0A942UVQ2_9FIRM|nr:TIGR01906 family membrane protein [Anaeromonas frigoriresistens]MBS4540119.1 TIGR01906 family membrane protein [Anaeromonas frigoriresistens]